MLTEKEMTALYVTIGVGAEQSNQNFTPDIIAQNQGYFNPSAEEIFEA